MENSNYSLWNAACARNYIHLAGNINLRCEIKKTGVKSKRSSKSGIAGLIANLILPGLCTIIIGKYGIGTVQIVLSLIGIFLLANTVGIILGIPFS